MGKQRRVELESIGDFVAKAVLLKVQISFHWKSCVGQSTAWYIFSKPCRPSDLWQNLNMSWSPIKVYHPCHALMPYYLTQISTDSTEQEDSIDNRDFLDALGQANTKWPRPGTYCTLQRNFARGWLAVIWNLYWIQFDLEKFIKSTSFDRKINLESVYWNTLFYMYVFIHAA